MCAWFIAINYILDFIWISPVFFINVLLLFFLSLFPPFLPFFPASLPPFSAEPMAYGSSGLGIESQLEL